METESAGRDEAVPSIVCLTSLKQFDALEPAWDALAARSPGAHLYQSHPWISAWMRHIDSAQPLILIAQRGSRLTAALPFAIHAAKGPLRLRTLRIIGDHADFCDVLSDPEYPQDLLQLWSALFARRDWHLLDCRYVRPDSHLAALAEAIPPSFHPHRQAYVIAPYLDLKTDWQESVSKGQRSDWQRRRRRLQEQGTLTLTTARAPEKVDALLAEFTALHIARWETKGETSSYNFQHYREFLREVCCRHQEKGNLRLYRLALDNETVSIGLYFLFGRRLLPYSYTFSAKYAKYCPLHLLIMSVVEEMQGQGLADVHDFGAGDEEYKLRWTDKSLMLDRILIARHGLGGAVAFWWGQRVKPFVWQHARLHTALRELRKRWHLLKGS